MMTTATTRPPNTGVSVARVPDVVGTFGLRTNEPAMASTGMMRKNLPTIMARPWVVFIHWVLAVMPANADPLLPAAEVKA